MKEEVNAMLSLSIEVEGIVANFRMLDRKRKSWYSKPSLPAMILSIISLHSEYRLSVLWRLPINNFIIIINSFIFTFCIKISLMSVISNFSNQLGSTCWTTHLLQKMLHLERLWLLCGRKSRWPMLHLLGTYLRCWVLLNRPYLVQHCRASSLGLDALTPV